MPSLAFHHPPDEIQCEQIEFLFLPKDLELVSFLSKCQKLDQSVRFDYLKQCPDINPNPGPGRPRTKN